MVPLVKKLLQKYFKSRPRSDVVHGIPSDSSDARPDRALLDNPVFVESSSKGPTNEFDPPPLYSPPLSSTHHNASGSMARFDPEPSTVPGIATERSGSAHRRWQRRVEPTKAPSDDSLSSDSEELEDWESDVEYSTRKYRHTNENKRPPQARNYQHTSPPRNHRARSSSYDARGQRHTSNRAFSPDGSFDAAFGSGGRFDTLFGQGGTFDTMFGTGGTFQPVVRGANEPQSTHFAYRDVNTNLSSASPPGGSSYVNSHMQPDFGNTSHWAEGYDQPVQNLDLHDSLRENRGTRFPQSEFQHRPQAQNSYRQQPANYNNISGQSNSSVSFFNNCRNVQINGMININHIETVHTMASPGTSTSTQTRRNYAYRNV